jgi:hypothetical protein
MELRPSGSSLFRSTASTRPRPGIIRQPRRRSTRFARGRRTRGALSLTLAARTSRPRGSTRSVGGAAISASGCGCCLERHNGDRLSEFYRCTFANAVHCMPHVTVLPCYPWTSWSRPPSRSPSGDSNSSAQRLKQAHAIGDPGRSGCRPPSAGDQEAWCRRSVRVGGARVVSPMKSPDLLNA